MSQCPCVTRSKYQLAKATAYEPNDKPEPKYTHKYVHNVLVDMLQALAKAAHPSYVCAPVCMSMCVCISFCLVNQFNATQGTHTRTGSQGYVDQTNTKDRKGTAFT